MDELENNESKSKILEPIPCVTEMHSVDEAVVANQLEPIDLYLEQPDGSKVRISFLASEEIEGVPQILPQKYQVVSSVEDSSSSLVQKASKQHTTFISNEAPQQISAVQTPDGQIFYFESNPPARGEKERIGEAPVFFRLLPKDLFATVESENDSLTQWADDNLTRDNAYSNAREKLKPFVTVRKTRRRTQSMITQIGTDLHLEDKMAARSALLPAKVRESGKKPVAPCNKWDEHAASGEKDNQKQEENCARLSEDISSNKCSNGKCANLEEQFREKDREKCGKLEDNCGDEYCAKLEVKLSEKCSKCGDKQEECAYPCDMCDATFPRASQFFGHSKAHTKERILACNLCVDNKVFVSHAQLQQHERTCHFSVRAHVCLACSASFERPSQLANHRRSVHLKERPNKCGVCDKTFFKRSDLRSHLNIHLGLDAHVCPTCGRRFSHVSNLNRHLRTHTGVRPFPCVTCGRRFAQASGLFLHAETHAFASASRKVACSVPACTALFSSSSARRAHMRVKHADVEPERQYKSAQRSRRFHCRVCGLAFPFAVLLRNHEAIHAKQETFRCTWCQQHFTSIETLKNHACRSPAQREREVERAVLAEQMEQLLTFSEPGESSGSQDIVIYVTHEGREQVVHLKQPVRKQAETTNIDTNINRATEQNQLHSQGLHNDMPKTVQNGVKAMDNGTVLQNIKTITAQNEVTSLENEMPITSQSKDIALQIEVPSNTNSEVTALQIQTAPHEVTSLENEMPITSQSCAKEVGLVVDWLNPLKIETEACCEGKEVDESGRKEFVKLETPSGEKSDLDDPTTPATTNAAKAKSLPVNKSFQCSAPGCEKSFLKRTNFKQHLGTHFADARSHLCPVCGESFAWRSTLGKHVLKHKPASQRPSYPCTICPKTYLSTTQVQSHMRRDHHNERPHKCPSCDKNFFKKHDLTVHVRTHTKETPYMCSTCGRCFGHASHAARHAALHAGHRPHVCPACGRSFAQAGTLRAHMARKACQPC